MSAADEFVPLTRPGRIWGLPVAWLWQRAKPDPSVRVTVTVISYRLGLPPGSAEDIDLALPSGDAGT